ncbi:Protein of unknown function [Cotesia congregata]|uniref:Zinc finger CCHC domain-containing protein 7 n=1 Tax=Cotesia congregata TaxID=51543 RepID=A0A8J2HFR0_COTCN|nr:Protein of unknown function [Cotesia congregata]
MSDEEKSKSYSLRKDGYVPFPEGLPPVTRKRNETKKFEFRDAFDGEKTVDSGLGKSQINPEITSDEDSEDEPRKEIPRADKSDTASTSNNNIDLTINNDDTLTEKTVSVPVDKKTVNTPVNQEKVNNPIDPGNNNNNNPEDPNNIDEMVLTANQSISLSDALAFVPRFDGVPEELIDFSKCCKEAKDVLPAKAEANLCKLIYGVKLDDKVKASLSHTIPATILDLTKNLKKIYVASKTVFQLQGELGQLYQGKGESVVDYANRLRKKVDEIIECNASDNPNMTEEENRAFKDKINSSLAAIFTHNLDQEIEQRMPICANVDEALAAAITIERKMKARNELMSKPKEKTAEEKKKKNPVTFTTTTDSRNPKNKTSNSGNNNNPNKNTNNGNGNSNQFDLSKINCRRCRKQGHFAKDCPERQCQICYEKGHGAKTCPQLAKTGQNQYANLRCQLCGQRGHSARYCKLNLNQVNPASNPEPSQGNYRHPPNTGNNNYAQNAGMHCDVCGLDNHTQENCRWLKTINFIQANARQSSSGGAREDHRNTRPVHAIQNVRIDEDSE